MKKYILAAGLFSSAALLSSCAVTTDGYTPEYSGYTVGYGYDNGYYGNGVYGGYGGWASSYYAPGYRYNSVPRAYYNGGGGYYRSGYVGRGGYRR